MLLIEINHIILPGNKLPKGALPIIGLIPSETSVDVEKVSFFQNLFGIFTVSGDPILSELVTYLSPKGKYSATVVTTSGIPAPYDAWTSQFEGKIAIFFNLDQWTVANLENNGLAVLKHEITHLILSKFLPKISNNDFAGRLNQIVLDEGIAHFIGFTGDRDSLLMQNQQRWEAAEKNLESTYKKLSSAEISVTEKEKLLTEATTGPFWDKYGAIAGMFRAAKLFKIDGGKGLAEAIACGTLNKPD